MSGISSKASNKLENKYRFNGIEQTTDIELNQYDAFYRNMDPQIGRFWQIDPKPTHGIGLYTAMSNNPIRYSDPLGDTLKINHKNKDYIYNDGNLFNEDGTAYTGKVKGFLKQTVKALNKMKKSNEFTKGVSQLQSSENNFVIKYGERPHFDPSNRNNAQAIQVIDQLAPVDASKPFNQIGSGGTIYFDPNNSATINGGVFSPEIVLTHEIGHALDADKGLMDRRLIELNGTCCEERSEIRATYFQNIVSQQLGPKYPLRMYYGNAETPPLPPALIKNGQPINVPPPAINSIPLRLTPIY